MQQFLVINSFFYWPYMSRLQHDVVKGDPPRLALLSVKPVGDLFVR